MYRGRSKMEGIKEPDWTLRRIGNMLHSACIDDAWCPTWGAMGGGHGKVSDFARNGLVKGPETGLNLIRWERGGCWTRKRVSKWTFLFFTSAAIRDFFGIEHKLAHPDLRCV